MPGPFPCRNIPAHHMPRMASRPRSSRERARDGAPRAAAGERRGRRRCPPIICSSPYRSPASSSPSSSAWRSAGTTEDRPASADRRPPAPLHTRRVQFGLEIRLETCISSHAAAELPISSPVLSHRHRRHQSPHLASGPVLADRPFLHPHPPRRGAPIAPPFDAHQRPRRRPVAASAPKDHGRDQCADFSER